MFNHCPDCGTNLVCLACNGTGHVTLSLPGGMCCGRLQSSNYCTDCGRLILPPPPEKCRACNGSGLIHHYCTPRLKF